MRKLCIAAVVVLFTSCSIEKKISREARQAIVQQPDFGPAHVGISLYDPAAGKYLYNYQGDKYFVPASNTKLLTCYSALKNLGDSLVSIRYVDKGNGTIELEGNGDASLLMPDFKNQRIIDFLKQQKKILLTDENWRDNALGAGWAWDDYNSDYMQERSYLPLYGNLVSVKMNGSALSIQPGRFAAAVSEAVGKTTSFSLRRNISDNGFSIRNSSTAFRGADIPFSTKGDIIAKLLADTLHNIVEPAHFKLERWPDVVKVHSQSTDSLLKIMMHRSDNFFAEQTLLMISNEKLAYMNTGRIIDTLLKTDLAGLPQKPKWVDGSGLSRYNLVTPQDFVWVLTQMKNEFRWERISTILATGDEGTLAGLYKNYKGRIYAKTGTLSNHLGLSGYITTKSGKQWIFSILVNAYQTPAATIRKQIEKFLTNLMDKY
jgi:D-alanyl-D-alanine carboxypeptidase/D-alanyl-D-alanine-endopeptidase (penicillin-binding protein 4)